MFEQRTDALAQHMLDPSLARRTARRKDVCRKVACLSLLQQVVHCLGAAPLLLRRLGRIIFSERKPTAVVEGMWEGADAHRHAWGLDHHHASFSLDRLGRDEVVVHLDVGTLIVDAARRRHPIMVSRCACCRSVSRSIEHTLEVFITAAAH